MEGYTVNVTNIANDGTDEEIKEFLSLVGPIKSFVPSRFERKVSAKVTYFDYESALMAIHLLGGEHFRNRDLKISALDFNDRKAQKLSPSEQITDDISKLSPQERSKFACLLSSYIKEEGEEFLQFLGRHKTIEESMRGAFGRY